MKWEVKQPHEKWEDAQEVDLFGSEFKGAAVEYAEFELFSPGDEDEFEFDLRRTDDDGKSETRRMTVVAEIRFFATGEKNADDGDTDDEEETKE